MPATITSKPYDWSRDDLHALQADFSDLKAFGSEAVSKYNPTPG